MKIHNFVEDSRDEYKRCIFCRRCGQVVWNYNYGAKLNVKLQASIKECVESGDLLTASSANKE